MKNQYDKNGNKLKGATVWMRTISEAGGLDKYNKKVALSYFENFIDQNPNVAESIAGKLDKEERLKKLRVVK